jgi:putative DNA primase/helicase
MRQNLERGAKRMFELAERVEIAAKLTAMGLPLFLIRPNDKRPLHAGWQKDATTDFETVREWLQLNPEANLGVATGGDSRLLVVDIDPRHNGDKSLVTLEATHGEFPRTLTVKTGGGGHHLYFSLPNGVSANNTAGTLAEGIDTRGSGGYVVAPGSNHESGGVYTVERDSETLAVVPNWLLQQLQNARTRKSNNDTSNSPRPSTQFAEGHRNADMFSLAGFLRHKGAEEKGNSGRIAWCER